VPRIFTVSLSKFLRIKAEFPDTPKRKPKKKNNKKNLKIPYQKLFARILFFHFFVAYEKKN
jgi:hypothetical protein